MKRFSLILVFLLAFSAFALMNSAVEKVKAVPTSVVTFSAMYPSDGDSWTEQTPDYWTDFYMDESWITSDVQYGTYALNMTHTGAGSSGYTYMTLPSQVDVSAYEFLFMRMKIIYSGTVTGLRFYVQNLSSWQSPKPYLAWAQYSGSPATNRWFTVAVALYSGDQINGAPYSILEEFQIFFMQLSVGTVASNATFLIDGLRFCNVTMDSSPDYSEQQILNNVLFYVESAEKTVTFQGASYTIPEDALNITDRTQVNRGLESESTSQLIHGYMLAYGYSSFGYFLDKSETYVQLMLASQDQSGVGYIPDKSNAMSIGSPTFAGWQLSALSQLYGATSNSTYRTSADSVRHFLVDYMWDEPNLWFDNYYNNATGSVVDASTLDMMKSGSAITGLAEYYYFVSQNTTVKDVIDKFFNMTINDRPATWVFKEGTWNLDASLENTAYIAWSYYYAGKRMSNQTYLNMWRDLVLRWYEQRVLIGFEDNYNFYVVYQNHVGSYSTNYGNWEQAQMLANVALGFSDYARIKGIVEGGLYEDWAKNQSYYGWEFRDAAGWHVLYIPMAGYIASAIQFYNSQESFSDPTILMTNGNVTSTSLGANSFSFSLFHTAGETTTTKIHCGDREEPEQVSGVSSSSYDSATAILTLTVTHSSEEDSYDPSANILKLNVTHLSTVDIIIKWSSVKANVNVGPSILRTRA